MVAAGADIQLLLVKFNVGFNVLDPINLISFIMVHLKKQAIAGV